jgi:hypothetical protein
MPFIAAIAAKARTPHSSVKRFFTPLLYRDSPSRGSHLKSFHSARQVALAETPA